MQKKGEKLKKFNRQAFAETICFAIFSGFVFYFILTKKYLQYIAPKTEPYLYFTAVIMVLWTVYRAKDIFSLQYKSRLQSCLLLIFPIVFVFLPHAPLSSVDFSSSYLKSDIVVSNNYLRDNQTNALKSRKPKYNKNHIRKGKMKNEDLQGIDFANKTIVVPSDQYYEWVIELFSNSEFYEGYTITMTGFVFKGNEAHPFAANEFVPARLVMYCCAADMTPIGLRSVYSDTATLELDMWVDVTGTIILREESGQMIPLILVEKITEAKDPDTSFIFANLS